jgi:hypothetical protein
VNAKAAKRLRRDLRTIIDGDPVTTEAMGRDLADRIGLPRLARTFRREMAARSRRAGAVVVLEDPPLPAPQARQESELVVRS